MFVFKIHSRCNLNCTYCYMYNMNFDGSRAQPKRVSSETIAGVIDMLRSHRQMTGRERYDFAFHGGEPLLVGVAAFRDMMDQFVAGLDGLDVSFGLQTNGTLIDREWVDAFCEYGIDVAVSLDGPPDLNDSYRRNHANKPTSSQTVRGIRLLQKHAPMLFGGVLAVAHAGSDGKQLIRYFRDELQIKSLQLLLPDNVHDDLPENWDKEQAALARTLLDAFDEWLAGDTSNFRVDIFREIMRNQREPKVERDAGTNAIVIETNGALHPHDVFRNFPGLAYDPGIEVGAGMLDRFHRTDVFLRGLNLHKRYHRKCRTCPQFDGCRAGIIEHRFSRESGFENPSVHCDALFSLSERIEEHLASTC